MNPLIEAKQQNGVLTAAHRGTSGGNIPCNSMSAFRAALMEGADIIELDVSRSKDGVLYVFHPGMEPAHIGKRKLISLRKSKKVRKLRYINQDNVKTSYGVSTLEEVLTFLKGKCFINIDKFWTAPEEITNMIYKCGVEEQVIIKTNCNETDFDNVEKYAPNLMFMPVISRKDSVTESLLQRNIRLIGAEVLFKKESDEVCSDAYIKNMHEKGLLLWGNAIVYNEKAVISAGHTDDCALGGNPDNGWKWFVKKGFDIVQTDWAGLFMKTIRE